ncbi:MAG: hypothetical protein IKM60_03320 [Clostridia bacterium]|nr:hypothetical protein [Clostridia bacterium]
MKLTLCTANPAGNITLLVETPVAPAEYHSVANQLMAIEQFHCEQVGFITEPVMGGDIRLEMMGGEFCGNATRCAGFYHAKRSGCKNSIPVEISGCDHVLQVEVDHDSAWAEMPLPVSVSATEVMGTPMTAVQFDGIIHLVAETAPFPKSQVDQLLPVLAKQFSSPAVGLLFLENDRMIPAIYVRETGSLVWENSCASGSAAVACVLASQTSDGIFRQALVQPGGTIKTEVIRRNNRTLSVRIGGEITLSDPVTIELPCGSAAK